MQLKPVRRCKRGPSLISSKLQRFVVLLAALLAAPGLSAHHGLARFDTTHIVEMKGTVTDFRWTNPHAYVYADLKDAHGKVANWSLECGSLGMFGRFGWSLAPCRSSRVDCSSRPRR
jgi:Family of unknown function (DUF6152)